MGLIKKLMIVNSILVIFIIFGGGIYLFKNHFYVQRDEGQLNFIKKSSFIRKSEKGSNFFQATGLVTAVNGGELTLEIFTKEKIKIFCPEGINVHLYTGAKDRESFKRLENLNLKNLPDLQRKEIAVVGIEIKKNFFEEELKALRIVIFPQEVKERPDLLNFVSVNY